MNKSIPVAVLAAGLSLMSCNTAVKEKENTTKLMKERQVTFLAKNHDLDNNDNFSPDDRFLCYDTRGTVYNTDLANCKSIEKVEIATGEETVLWSPEYVTGDQAAPGIAAVSWHPKEDKVVFIHGPLLDEVEERGYYGIRNRTGVEVSGDGKENITKVDLRDVATDRPTIPGAQRGGTHRHEYTRSGNRIGFTYDDHILQGYGRTIGYMEAHPEAPEGYSHYFTVLLNTVKMDEAKPGDIVKAYGDSWVDSQGSMRAFIADLKTAKADKPVTALYVAEIPEGTDITTSYSGDKDTYPTPPEGIKIRRLTNKGRVAGIVRGSYAGDRIAYLCEDENGIMQVCIINAQGSDLSGSPEMQPVMLTNFNSNATTPRWHPSDKWIFAMVEGNIAAIHVESKKSFYLTEDELDRGELVVSNKGNMLAYSMVLPHKEAGKDYRQIFVMELDWKRLNEL